MVKYSFFIPKSFVLILLAVYGLACALIKGWVVILSWAGGLLAGALYLSPPPLCSKRTGGLRIKKFRDLQWVADNGEAKPK